MEREADEFVDFRESARFRAFPAGDSELRKWTVSRSAAKLPLHRSIRKRTLGSISCNTTTSRPLRLIPSQLSTFGVIPGLRLVI